VNIGSARLSGKGGGSLVSDGRINGQDRNETAAGSGVAAIDSRPGTAASGVTESSAVSTTGKESRKRTSLLGKWGRKNSRGEDVTSSSKMKFTRKKGGGGGGNADNVGRVLEE
jgi:hypothetical protein